MVLLWLMAAGVVFLVIYYQIDQKRRRALWIEQLRESWGKVPEQEYEEEDLRRIARYYEMCRNGEYSLDDITWNDLDLDEIFMLLNHTHSSVGEEALYRLLRTPVSDEAVLKERDRLASLFAQDEELRLSLEKSFSSMGKRGRQALCDYISNLSKQPLRSNGVHYLGAAALAASAVLIAFAAPVGIAALIAVLAFQIISYYQQKGQVETHFASVAQVVRLTVYGREIASLKEDGLAAYLESLGEALNKLEPIRKKSRFIVMGNAMGGSPLDVLADYVKMLLHIDLIAYNQIVARAKDREQAIWDMVRVLGEMECGLAIASFRVCLGQWSCPVFCGTEEGLGLFGEELYHPLIDRPVPNTVCAGRSQLITGSNASGKSTFLKTTALGAVLAQTVYTVPGTSYRAPFYQIYTSMALRDNLIGGESYYMAEIRSLKRILDRGSDELPVLCFVDEVLRGTNTVERIAASAQILKSMTRQNILCFAATHDGELTWLLEDCYDNSHFEEEVTDGDVLFSYRLLPGRAQSRNALKLLGLMGYDRQVLEDAEAMAKRFLETGIWTMNKAEQK